MRFQSGSSVMEVQQTFIENVVLKKGGTLSLYWVRRGQEFKAAIIRRFKGKIFGNFYTSWDQAKKEFTARILKEGVRNGKRALHILSLYVAPDQHSDLYRCIAVCKTGRKTVDVLHKDRIGSIALAFRAMRAECGCRHRKKYEELDGHWFSVKPRKDAITYAS